MTGPANAGPYHPPKGGFGDTWYLALEPGTTEGRKVNHMKTSIKRGIVSGALALSLLGGSAAGVVAQKTNQGQQGGAAGLVVAVVQAGDDFISVGDIEVVSVDIKDSLNNLTALNNILNNSPILSNNDIDVVDVVDVGDINVDVLNDSLDALDLVITDVIAVAVLSGGDLIFLT